eukprot:3153137-Rhodomonas_salina.2
MPEQSQARQREQQAMHSEQKESLINTPPTRTRQQQQQHGAVKRTYLYKSREGHRQGHAFLLAAIDGDQLHRHSCVRSTANFLKMFSQLTEKSLG